MRFYIRVFTSNPQYYGVRRGLIYKHTGWCISLYRSDWIYNIGGFESQFSRDMKPLKVRRVLL